MTITRTPIGTVNDPDSGHDEYVLLTTDDDALSLEQAHLWLFSRVHSECQQAGGYFCNTVLVQKVQYHNREVIAIIQHRYDI